MLDRHSVCVIEADFDLAPDGPVRSMASSRARKSIHPKSGNVERDARRGSGQGLQTADGCRNRRLSAHDRADPGADSVGPRGGHAVQDQGRNLKTKARIDKSYRGTDALDESSFERRPIQYLYRDNDALHFMESASFNQFSLSLEELRDQAEFMTENMEGVEALVVDDEVIAIELPDTVELPIIETAPESAATRRPGAPSRPRCRRVSWSRSQSTLTRGRRFGSTPGRASTWDGRIRRLIIGHRSTHMPRNGATPISRSWL